MSTKESTPESPRYSANSRIGLVAFVMTVGAIAVAADLAWMAPGRIPVQGSAVVTPARDARVASAQPEPSGQRKAAETAASQ
jgi:hypothetical protein